MLICPKFYLKRSWTPIEKEELLSEWLAWLKVCTLTLNLEKVNKALCKYNRTELQNEPLTCLISGYAVPIFYRTNQAKSYLESNRVAFLQGWTFLTRQWRACLECLRSKSYPREVVWRTLTPRSSSRKKISITGNQIKWDAQIFSWIQVSASKELISSKASSCKKFMTRTMNVTLTIFKQQRMLQKNTTQFLSHQYPAMRSTKWKWRNSEWRCRRKINQKV